MKVLVVGDFTQQPCGIRNFADQTVTALQRHPGLTVDKWDGNYPLLYARREAGLPCQLPEHADDYDVIHLVWHPIAFNTYRSEHFTFGTKKPLISVYLTDIPPWSGCPFMDVVNVAFAAEESPGCVVLPYPVADWIDDLPSPLPDFTVGCSTVRGEGVDTVRAICDYEGWKFRTPDRSVWLSFEDEVRRMAQNTVNVLWYDEQRGKSGGLSQAISARRPVVCSESAMFSHFEPYYFSFYRGSDAHSLLWRAYRDSVEDGLRFPLQAALDCSWSKATATMVEAWKATR